MYVMEEEGREEMLGPSARVTIPAQHCIPDHSGTEGHWNVLG